MKKTILPFFLLFAILFSVPAFAVQGKLTADSVSGKVGEQITVRVHLDNPGIIDTRVFVSYDSKVLHLDSAENGDVFADNLAVFGKDTGANPYILLWDDSLNTSNNTKSGTLFSLQFTVRSGTADGKTSVTVRVDDASTFDTNLQSVSISGCTASVTVPTVTTVPATSQTTAKPTSAQTTQKTTTPSTTTQKTTSAIEAPTAGKGSTTRAQTVPSTTGASPSAQPTASVSAPVTKKQDVPATVSEKDVEPNTAPQTAQAVTGTAVPDESADTGTQSAGHSEAEIAASAPAESKPSRLRFLWLLLLLPVLAAAVLLIQKKKR